MSETQDMIPLARPEILRARRARERTRVLWHVSVTAGLAVLMWNLPLLVYAYSWALPAQALTSLLLLWSGVTSLKSLMGREADVAAVRAGRALRSLRRIVSEVGEREPAA